MNTGYIVSKKWKLIYSFINAFEVSCNLHEAWKIYARFNQSTLILGLQKDTSDMYKATSFILQKDIPMYDNNVRI